MLRPLDSVHATPNVVAHTAALPPNPDISKDVSLDLKDPEVKDVGWNRDPVHIPAPLIRGLSNDDVYTLIRRFNKVRSS